MSSEAAKIEAAVRTVRRWNAKGWGRTVCPLCPGKVGTVDRHGTLGINGATGGYHCLGLSTEVITKQGVQPLWELVRQTREGNLPTLLTSGPRGGTWVKAPVTMFGVQATFNVKLSRNRVDRTIVATEGHRWFVRRGKRWVEQTTAQLRPGDRMKSVRPPRSGTLRPSPWAVAAGFVFGDGTLPARSSKGATVHLWGQKDLALLPFFPWGTRASACTERGLRGVRISGLPRTWKHLPSRMESSTYLYGWLAGYFAADGCVATDGTCTLASADKGHLEFVRDVALRLGIVTYGIKVQQRKGYKEGLLFSIAFARSTLSSEFFVIPKHRERFEANREVRERLGWKVVSVEPTGRSEDVACAEVPGTHSFALADHLLTGNCFRCESRGRINMLIPAVAADLSEPSEPEHDFEPPPGFVALGMEPARSSLSCREPLDYLRRRGVSDFVVTEAQIGAVFEGERMHEGRIFVPILDSDNRTWRGWSARLWDRPKSEDPWDDLLGLNDPAPVALGRKRWTPPKYLYPSGMDRAHLLYNSAALDDLTDEPLLLVEGVFDALPYYPQAVAFLGKPSEEQVERLMRSERPLVACLDGDAWQIGEMLSMRLRFAGRTAGWVKLPPKEDPGTVDPSWLLTEAERALP